MLTDTENRELCGYLGICWHEPQSDSWVCSCGIDYHFTSRCRKHCKIANPDFSDPAVVLRGMKKREDWPKFKRLISCGGYAYFDSDCIKISYVEDTTGLLARAALEWLRKQKEV